MPQTLVHLTPSRRWMSQLLDSCASPCAARLWPANHRKMPTRQMPQEIRKASHATTTMASGTAPHQSQPISKRLQMDRHLSTIALSLSRTFKEQVDHGSSRSKGSLEFSILEHILSALRARVVREISTNMSGPRTLLILSDTPRSTGATEPVKCRARESCSEMVTSRSRRCTGLYTKSRV